MLTSPSILTDGCYPLSLCDFVSSIDVNNPWSQPNVFAKPAPGFGWECKNLPDGKVHLFDTDRALDLYSHTGSRNARDLLVMSCALMIRNLAYTAMKRAGIGKKRMRELGPDVFNAGLTAATDCLDPVAGAPIDFGLFDIEPAGYDMEGDPWWPDTSAGLMREFVKKAASAGIMRELRHHHPKRSGLPLDSGFIIPESHDPDPAVESEVFSAIQDSCQDDLDFEILDLRREGHAIEEIAATKQISEHKVRRRLARLNIAVCDDLGMSPAPLLRVKTVTHPSGLIVPKQSIAA